MCWSFESVVLNKKIKGLIGILVDDEFWGDIVKILLVWLFDGMFKGKVFFVNMSKW